MLSEQEIISKLKGFYNAIVNIKEENKTLKEQNGKLLQEKQYLEDALSSMKSSKESDQQAKLAFDEEMVKLIAQAEEVLASN